MSGRSDYQLLREYVDSGSQMAFAELVGRHVNLVYTAAHRQVRDRHAAEDVAQGAFVVLAQKGPSLRPGTLLSAWLLGVTRMVARNWIKSESRRRRRELVAARERSQQMDGSADNTVPLPPDRPEHPDAPDETAPAATRPGMLEVDDVLDDAMARLSDGARHALVLRFFEGRSFREVGDELGISEDAAKQRVFRGLERLRSVLGRNGVGISAQALALALAATAVLPAPQGLAATLAAAATTAGAAAKYALLVKGATAAFAWSKAATPTLVVAGSVLLFSAAGVALMRGGGNGVGPGPGGQPAFSNPGAPPPTARLVAGNIPSGWVPPTPWEVLREPYQGPPVTGVVSLPDGAPAADAEVLLSVMSDPVAFYDRGLAGGDNEGVRTTRSGQDGQFSLAPSERPLGVIARNRFGYATASVASGGTSTQLNLTLQPWARVEGSVTYGGKPAAGATVHLNAPAAPKDAEGWVVNHPRIAQADASGRFTFDQVVPGEAWVGFQVGGDGAPMSSRFRKCIVAADGTTTLKLGGTGRQVVGRVDAAAAAAGGSGRLDLAMPPHPSSQPNFDGRPETERRDAEARWKESPGYKAYETRHDDEGPYWFEVGTDGKFRVEDVAPGWYVVAVNAGPGVSGELLFEVPEPTTGKSEEPHDVGQVLLATRPQLKTGDAMPPLAGTDLAGGPVSLAGFRGKYMLLHPWRSSDGTSTLEAGWLKTINDRFGRDGRLTIVGLNLDDPAETAAEWARRAGMNWPQIRLGGPPPTDVPDGLLTQPLTHCLIDPEGKIVALGLDGPRAYGALDKALAPPPQDARVRFEKGDRATTRAGTPFKDLPAPAKDDAATGATFTAIDGRRDRVGGPQFLHDGMMPPEEDAPPYNFFLMPGTLGGRLRVDLGRKVEVAQVNTYSWHKDTRAPQVYVVWGSDGAAAGFDGAPMMGTDPASCDWTRIAVVDTRPRDGTPPGGRHAVSIASPDGAALGAYQYLLFELFVTETDDTWGHTFYSEIDVVEKE